MANERAWREFDDDISMMLENTPKRTLKRKLDVMGDLIFDFVKGQVWSLGSSQGTSCTDTKQAPKASCL